MEAQDGYVNLVSGLGTDRDKGAQGTYAQSALTSYDLLTAYQASSLVRRAVDLPAEDACREWREWQAEAVDISAIEAEEKRLGVQGKAMQARKWARLFGGAALLIGTGDTDPTQPLDPERVRKGGLKYMTVLMRDHLAAGELVRDPLSDRYGQPAYWTMNGQGNSVRLHPSRLVLFHGVPPMDALGMTVSDGWGGSVLSGMMEPLSRVDAVAGNTLSLVYEAKVDVVKIPGFMMNLQTRGDAYSTEVLRRMRLAAIAKGINGMLVMDTDEEYDQKTASFGGLPEVMDRFMQLASAATGIPMTLLFGMSPGGLNATGAGDTRNYYDRVKVEQTLQMQPAMSVLDECVIRSALGSRPADLHYTWRPLWQPTAKERADNGKVLADTIKVVADMDVLPIEALGQALVNGLTETGAFPGLEAAVAEFYAGNPDLDETPEPDETQAEPSMRGGMKGV